MAPTAQDATGIEHRVLSPPSVAQNSEALTKSLTIGAPCTFTSGQFEGETVRVVLTEIQKADVGRKFAIKDRRPLDPPPTVKLQIFTIYNVGELEQREVELDNYNDFRPEGWICHVDLFRKTKAAGARRRPLPSTPTPSSSRILYNAHGEVPPPSFHQPELASQLDPTCPSFQSQDGAPLGEQCTTELAGSRFMQAFKLPIAGRSTLLFSFADLSVRAEGEYVLRYRAFNLLSVAAGPSPTPVLAECVGGVFRVYNTKEFPGLAPSTKLTKAMSAAGVRFNTREAERKGHPGSGKRKAEDE